MQSIIAAGWSRNTVARLVVFALGYLTTLQFCLAQGHVQSNATGFQSGGSTTIQLAFTAGVTAGNLIFAHVGSENQNASACSDNQGNRYSPVADSVTYFDTSRHRQFYAIATTGGSVTVTCTFAASAPWRALTIAEYSGVSTSAPLHLTNHATGASGTLNSGNVTTTVANVLLIGAGSTWDSNSFTAGTNYTLRSSAGPQGLEDRIVSATGTFGATMNQSANLNWGMRIAAFTLASGPPAGRRRATVTISD